MSEALPDSLRGHLLVAAPSLLDPNFHRTVVLIGEHGAEGAMGVVLNRPSGVTVGEAVPPLVALVAEDGLVYVGGPVQPEAIVVLGEFEEPERADVLVVGAVGFLPGEIEGSEALGTIARSRVFAGYAGWGAGQLEAELAESSWIVEPALPDDVFAADPAELWSDVLRRKGGPYAVLALMPPDPSLN
jgi:putative transcriptional regulator